MEKIRIEKYLSENQILSRREAKDFIEKGYILLNGKVLKETGIKIDPEKDKIKIKKEGLKAISKKETILVYKPRGVICSKDKEKGETIFDVFAKFKHLNNVGRLDKESEGLLLLSNDGMITKLITGKDHTIEKEYIVTVREDVLPWMIKKMEIGIKIDRRKTLPAKAKKIDKHTFSIILKEGRKHQIRRMADFLHLTVTSLKRVRIGKLKIKNMKPRNFKVVTRKEI